MTPPISSAEAQALLEHSGWVRALARKLVRDPNLADDLAQETWLAAFEHRPSNEGNLRAWLGTVLRNLVRQVGRGEDRREARERASARPEAVDSTLDVVERMSLHRQVVEAVMELAEPYRTVILLRYFETRTPTQIAARLGVPVSTVKTRLARGIELLRQRLDREHAPDGRSMLMALVPLTLKTGGSPAPLLGALFVSTQVKIVLACALALAGAYVFWPDQDESPLERSAAAAPHAELQNDVAGPGGTAVSEAPQIPQRQQADAASGPAESTEPVVAASPASAPILGRTLDALGHPLAGEVVAFVAPGRASVALSGEEPSTVSDVRGRFSIEGAPPEGGRIVAAGSDCATIYAGVVRGDRTGAESVVVVAQLHPLGGQVVDEAGLALAGARVALHLPEGLRGRLGNVMDHSDEVFFTTESDATGRFDLPRAPFVTGARILATREGYERFDEPLPAWPDTSMTIVLPRPDVDAGMLTGQVVDAHSVPVPEARVSLGLESTRTDESGMFAFDLTSEESMNAVASRMFGAPPAKRLFALKPGFLPARLDLELDDEGRPRSSGSILLQLGGETLSIAGKVVDGDGSALEGIDVWVGDATLFGASRNGVEVLESVLDGQPERKWNYVSTDSAGRFEITGLIDREYDLEAMDPNTLLRAPSQKVRSGRTDVVVTVPHDAYYERVSGRVVSKDGQPVPGVHVSPMCNGFELRYQGQVVNTSHASLEGAVSAADGSFELRRIPRELVFLRLDSDDIISTEYGRGVEGGLTALSKGRIEELVIEVGLRVRMRVVLSDPSRADSLSVLDERDQKVTVNIISARGRREVPVVAFAGGATEVLTVTDSAQTLVLYADGEEVERIPLALVRGEVNEIRP